MDNITTQTIIEGGILITLIFIAGVLVKILRTVISIDNTVKGGNKGEHPIQPGYNQKKTS